MSDLRAALKDAHHLLFTHEPGEDTSGRCRFCNILAATPEPTLDAALETVRAAGYIAHLDEGECYVSDAARPCVYCGGRRWVDDENWSPAYPETWDGTRREADGLIPCGGCNEGGWDVPLAARLHERTASQEGATE